jgi:hypothetical protein
MFDDFDGPAGRLPDPALWAPWLSVDKGYIAAHTDIRAMRTLTATVALPSPRYVRPSKTRD